VTGQPVRPVLGDYATSMGAALLAAVAAGAFENLEAAAAAAVELAPEPVLPRPAAVEVYDEAYAAYRRLFDGVEGALA